MRRYVDTGLLPGLALMVARRGKVVLNRQLGWADTTDQTPMQEDSVCRIYSMTKPIVCTALMCLYEQGRFRLFDPVAQYLPEFETMQVMDADGKITPAQQPITVGMLMTHTSGLSYDFLPHTPVAQLYRQAEISADGTRSLADMVAKVASMPLARQPGTAWHYGVGIDVAARLIEVLETKALGQVLQELLFAPLGMTDTAFRVPKEKQNRLATLYGQGDIALQTLTELAELSQDPMRPIDVERSYPVDDPGYARGGLGLYSTAGDYLRFAQMLLNDGELEGERVIGRKTLELMHANHLSPALLPLEVMPEVEIGGYGFGLGSRVLLDVAQSQMPGSVGEFGWAGAARTYYWVDPHEELVGVLMTQLLGTEQPQKDFQALVYQAVVD
jgi:CubicO group peptidase (beta-lactamase class C family)